MILGLSIETSGRLGSVAITDDGRVVAEDIFSHGLKHAAEMVPRIDSLVKTAGWQPADIREIYVSVGPGSFTGLRIGITLAKTLAFATGAKIVATPTVEVLAYNAPVEAREVVIVLDAKRDQIFSARLQRRSTGVPPVVQAIHQESDWAIVEPAHLDSIREMLARSLRPVYLIGEGIPFHEKFLPPDDNGIIVTLADAWRARAAVVAGVGHRMAREGHFTDLQALVPLYIRKPEAEEKYEQKHVTVK